jgi:ubiquinone/menaquinone biosynthesis C-methylase UbiE
MARTDWPVAFFDDDYLRIYRPLFTEEATRAEAEFITGALAIGPGSAVLDLACGTGRHAVRVAERGVRVTGLDFNPRYLEVAADEARRAGVEVRWMAGDMRALPFEHEFDAVYSFYTSFGYFGDDENERVLAGVARALKPGGRFLLEMANRDWILTHPLQRVWNQREDGSLHMEESSLDLVTSRVVSRMIHITPDGGPHLTKEYELRVYTCAELTALCARHGLAVRQVWGGADRSAYGTESRRLVLVAERGAEPGPRA